MLKIEKDFEELLGLFNKHDVTYCIIGAFAVAFHSVARYTKDMDILVAPNHENAKRIVAALHEFGFGSLGLTEDDFVKPSSIIQLGHEPVRIDLINSITGCAETAVWANRQTGTYGQHRVFFLGREELIGNKRAVARPQDIADIARLADSSNVKKP